MEIEADERFPLLRNRLKDKIAEGGLAICLRVTLASTNEIAFIAYSAGFDALYVDLEHSTASLADAAQICSTATALGVTPLVRIGSVDDEAAGKLLDAGCQGVIAAQVETAEQAQRLVDRCLFPPLGQRCLGEAVRQLGYQTLPPQEQWRRLNDATLLCVMLESDRAVAEAAQIAAVQGIDLLLVGTHGPAHPQARPNTGGGATSPDRVIVQPRRTPRRATPREGTSPTADRLGNGPTASRSSCQTIRDGPHAGCAPAHRHHRRLHQRRHLMRTLKRPRFDAVSF